MIKKRYDVTGFALKLIAIVTMAIDHIGAVFLWDLVNKYGTDTLADTYEVFRDIGRLAFPLFCFFIVEGFHYTGNRKKYALRLAVFAVIAEVPFDLAFDNTFFAPRDNSVMITLFLGLVSIWVLDTLFDRSAEKFALSAGVKEACDIFSLVAVVIAAGLIEKIAKSDYGTSGVVTIIIIYLFRRNFYLRPETGKLLGFAAAVTWLGFTCDLSEFFALFDLIPLCFYHGRQGRKMKYFFYVFYPAHLLVIAVIARVTGLYAYM
ncbi:MAG: conjugal transfer protein TraX [Lachnospiraceae bacterium]|uniref:Conjugal transfer protein TraX n=1 Tax=Candidatus Weimeria bifida TaxID=2599074 RepID=A0A6N7IX80_9FIRM|nr:conjugal transfer protein TraX [Candidatus Weimeria bifida]RRF97182.1 MAG: conjugal transfer protein TraX [Lachnospiraceae bacterium]